MPAPPERPERLEHPAPPAPPRRPGLRTVQGRLTPCLTLQTLGRGEGLLGLCREGVFGPREAPLTLAWIDWQYWQDGQLLWQTPAPRSVLGARPLPTERLRDAGGQTVLLHRDLAAEGQATERLRALGLHPLQPENLQWRSPEAARLTLTPEQADSPWSLPQEGDFGDFWAEQVPGLREAGWRIVVQPGFAHLSVPVQAWRLLIEPDSGDLLGREVAGPLGARAPAALPPGPPAHRGAWFLSLGVVVEGQTLDLGPILADLLRRDPRWRSPGALSAIDDLSPVSLRAPGGRRLEAPAGALKPIVAALLDLLAEPRQAAGPWRLQAWDLPRLDLLRGPLEDSTPGGAPALPWHVEGEDHLGPWVRRLREAGAPPAVAPPAGLPITLRPYQLQGLAWLQYLRAQGLHGVLADDMGLGKTAQTIAHLLLEHQAGRLQQPALVLLPASLIFNWQHELARLAPGLRVLALQGAERAAHFAQLGRHQVVLTSYSLLWRDLGALRAQRWQWLILDEAQMVKNADSRGARALRQLQAEHRLCLTGTPLENHLGELWSLFDFLMPGFLGTARHFQQHWRRPIESQGDPLRARLLAARVRPFILRRRKDEVAPELPPRIEITRRVSLQGVQRELYESVRVTADHLLRRVLQRQGLAGAQISILDALLKLRQVCCDPSLVPGLPVPPDLLGAKLEDLQSLLPELVDGGRRVLVFSQFTGLLARVGALLDTLGIAWLRLTGDTPVAARAELVRDFQALRAPVFLISLKAGGTGLNLTAADTVIHLDPWWNPAVEQQASDRAHRIGQTRSVFIYRLVVQGSIEERMLALQERKARLAENLLGQDAAEAGKFSAAELDGLLLPLDDAAD